MNAERLFCICQTALPAANDIQALKQYLQKTAPFLGGESHGGSTGFSALDRLLGGGFPKGAITAVIGEVGTGCLTVAARALAEETRGRPAAWVDAKGTLYPPALVSCGVELSRLLMVRAQPDKALQAAEQIIATGAFGVVVIGGVERGVRAPQLRRIQTATEGARVCTLMLLSPVVQSVTGAALRLRLGRKGEAISVEVEKDRSGRANGRRVLLRG